jgi:hypothetical protein
MAEAVSQPSGAEVPGTVSQAIANIAYGREMLPERLGPRDVEVAQATLSSLVRPAGPPHLLSDSEAPLRNARLETYAETEREVMTVLEQAAAVRGYRLVPNEEQGA